MLIYRYHIEDLDHGPATILNASRRVFDEYLANKKAREDRDLFLYELADAAREGRPIEAAEADFRQAAFLPPASRNVLATCSASFHPDPGRHKEPAGAMPCQLGMDGIQTRIIQLAGRWCVRHAADVLLNLASLQPLDLLECGEVPEPGRMVEWAAAIGFRADGVDGNDYVMSRLRASRHGTPYVYPERDYRQLTAAYVRDELDPDGRQVTRQAALLDLTHEVNKLDPSDEEGA